MTLSIDSAPTLPTHLTPAPQGWQPAANSAPAMGHAPPPARTRDREFPVWAVPAALVGFVIFVVSVLAAVAFGFKYCDVADLAVAEAEGHPVVVERIGAELDRGFVSGSIESGTSGGEAALRIPVEGAAGSGTLYAEASKRAGQWELDALTLQIEGERVDLL